MKTSAANDLRTLQGAWNVASLEIDGAPVGSAMLNGATIVVSGERFTTSGMGAEFGGRLELAVDRQPKALTMLFDSGPEAGNTNYGIYEITGEQWRLCLNMSGGPAPAAFKTTPGSAHALETLVRAVSTPTAPEAPIELDAAAREPVPELQGEWAMVSCLRSGEPLPAGFVQSGKRTVAGTTSILFFGNHMYMRGSLSKDSAGPTALKLEHTGGEAQGTTQLGIFDLDGDTLKTCFGSAGRERPAQFASTAAGGETYTVWKRVRDPKHR